MLCKNEHRMEKGERQEPLVRASHGWGCGADARGRPPRRARPGRRRAAGPSWQPSPGPKSEKLHPFVNKGELMRVHERPLLFLRRDFTDKGLPRCLKRHSSLGLRTHSPVFPLRFLESPSDPRSHLGGEGSLEVWAPRVPRARRPLRWGLLLLPSASLVGLRFQVFRGQARKWVFKKLRGEP